MSRRENLIRFIDRHDLSFCHCIGNSVSAPSWHLIATRRELGTLVVEETRQRESIAFLNIGWGPIPTTVNRIGPYVTELLRIDFKRSKVELRAPSNER
jgi:hypothetical protein